MASMMEATVVSKPCKLCGEIKPLDEFHRNKATKDGRVNKCKACIVGINQMYHAMRTPEEKRAYARDYTSRNRPAVRARQRKYALQRRIEASAILVAAKTGPCTDCGVVYPPQIMDLDHVRGIKKFAPSRWMHHTWSMDVLRAEITKCEVRCPTCHRMRHWLEKNC